MTTTDTPIAPRTIDDVLAAIEQLDPAIAARAPEIEATRRIPGDLWATVLDTGVARLLRPASHGGFGASIREANVVIERLAAADASTAWTAMIGGMSWIDLLGLPRDVFDGLWTGSTDVVVAGVFNPSGTISPVHGAYEVSGRWSLASGCEHADWAYVNCVEGMTDGGPQLRIALLEPDQMRIEDTWHVSGLRGTGSQHIAVTGVRVPVERTTVPLHDPPCLDDPIARIPTPTVVGFPIAAVALGTAASALGEIARLATDKVPLLDQATLATNPLFRADFALADTELRAARALVAETADAVWSAALAGDELTIELRARARAATTYAVQRSAAVVEAAYRAGGSHAIYDDSPLQRQLRDVNAITQHFIVKRDTFASCGAAYLGHEVGAPVF